MEAVVPDLTYLRNGTAALVGSVRLYMDRRHDDIQPLLDGFTPEELWDAHCLLIVSTCALDGPDLETLAARVRVVGQRLADTDPSTDPEMVDVSSAIVVSFAQARAVDGGIDIPTPAEAVAGQNLYPWVMAFCLMTVIAAMVWEPAGADAQALARVVDEAAQDVNELVDLAQADALATATAAVMPTSDAERRVAVLRLALLMLSGRLVDPGVRQDFMVGKEPVQVGPYVIDAMLLATTAAHVTEGEGAMWQSPNLEGLRSAARQLVTQPHPDPDLQERVVGVLADALSSTTGVGDGVYTPMTRFGQDVTADDLLAALGHVGDVIVETVYSDPGEAREALVVFLESALADVR